ncbi:hypothetical protein SteCoe_26331 [Stentor coeruleus]|uniref:EF-hand domain-containing protein n=1 Tax=Stentor coeruleus TaxID=5963 RepID=A0A1R2BD52_9CILI|nr:hypothetical protein SteCoe_26331 [Stentor coeruleus]
MGCADSQIQGENTGLRNHESLNDSNLSASQSFIQVEKDLGLNQHKSDDLDKYFHRYSYAEEISQENLFKVGKIIGFDAQSKKEFFDQFMVNTLAVRKVEMLNSRRICTLSIILGSGSDNDKIKLLFQNYDLDSNKYLDKQEVIMLIEDILWIFLYAVPNYTLLVNGKNTLIGNEVQKLNSAQSFAKNDIVAHILDSESRITMESYARKFTKKEVKMLFNPERLRNRALEIYEKFLQHEKELEMQKQLKEKEEMQMLKKIKNSDDEGNEHKNKKKRGPRKYARKSVNKAHNNND